MIATLMNNPMLILILLAVVAYFWRNRVEMFEVIQPVVTPEEYYQDIRNINSYVGPYIGEIYTYLRAKYFDPENNVSLQPYFQPAGVNDPTLADPLLPIARAQIKAWIDSAKLRINKK